MNNPRSQKKCDVPLPKGDKLLYTEDQDFLTTG